MGENTLIDASNHYCLSATSQGVFQKSCEFAITIGNELALVLLTTPRRKVCVFALRPVPTIWTIRADITIF